MDGSLADYTGAMFHSLKMLQSPCETPITEESLWDDKHDYISNRMRLVKAQPGWWLNLKPIKMGMDALDICRLYGFDIHVLTKGPKKHSNAWAEKVEWCQKHINIDVDIHVTSDKGLVYGKLLYDDYPDYMDRWLKNRPRGLGIMPVNSYNKDYNHPNVVKWTGENMDELVKAIIDCKNRKVKA
jgi:hypothetical protein